MDACELLSEEGKVHLFLAIDLVFKFAQVEPHPAPTMIIGAAFLHSIIEVLPDRIHTVRTDKGATFADRAATALARPPACAAMLLIGSAASTWSLTNWPSPIRLAPWPSRTHELHDQ